jgi:hypothetical protein
VVGEGRLWDVFDGTTNQIARDGTGREEIDARRYDRASILT